MEPLKEVELIALADDIDPDKYLRLCNALGYTYARGQATLRAHLKNVYEALAEILITWKTNQKETDQLRSILASKLHEVGLGDLGDSLSKGSYHLNRRDQRDRHDRETVPSQMPSAEMATGRGIADDLLVNLAEDIETGEQMESLGRALGFKSAAINRYAETGRLEGRVTCKGTRDLLFDWRRTVEPSNQHLRLKEALINAKLVMLADTYLKDTPASYHLNRRDQRDRHDPETVPSPTWSADIYAKKISESLTVGKCREKLVNKYMNQHCKIQKAPWDPNDLADFKDLHTVVTMVKKDAHGKDTKTKEILQGSVTKIFSKEVNGVLPGRILISAPAGRGKTTAVAKMAYDWANRVQGSSLENLPLLFLVKLRNTSEQTSIAEAIRSQLLSDVTDLTEDGLHRFIKENQGICHILLDGLDEYAGIAAIEGLGSNIVDVMLWEEFPDCRVLVTTRPHLENFFNQGELPRVYTKMWIEGFSRESSREYIDKFFASSSDSSKAQDMKAYLDNEPLINELVITPLFCLMVCHLWNEGLLGEDIRTQTELLDSVNVFMMHHCNARLKSRKEISEEKLHTIIRKLGKVALYGLLDDAKKLVFTPHDFRKVPNILEVACELGVISKTIVSSTRLPQSHKTSSTTIEFYHKIVQEHSAGKYIAAKSKKRLWPWQKTSLLERVLSKIEANIGDYENLIRFAAGTENNLCIMIMEALLSNNFLDESERYRILLDCSSETSVTEGGVSSLVKRCVTAQRMVLKSPTVYTVVGMQNLSEQLKGQIREVKFEDSTPSTDVVSGLWSCLGDFSALRNLTISDCSFGSPPSSSKLPLVRKLKIERVTSQSYEGLLSSIPNVKEIDIAVGNVEEEDISQIQTSLFGNIPGQELTLIRLDGPHSLPPEESVSGETMRGLGLLTSDRAFREATLSGVICGPEETVIDLVQSSTRLMSSSLYTEQFSESLNSDRHACNMFSLTIRDCKLTAMMTCSIWSCLKSFPSLGSLIISDSSLSFPPSPPELTSVTRLEAERVTSQCYEGLLSSIPNVNDITVGNAENEDMFQIQSSLCRHLRGQELTLIRLDGPHSLPSEESVSGMPREMRGLGLFTSHSAFREATLFRVTCVPEETVIDLVQRSTRLMSSSLYTEQLCGSLNSDRHACNMFSLTIRDCKLTAEITSSMWSCLRSFPSLSSLIISDSSLSFPPSPPELTSVTELKTEGATSQSYEGLLSSIPNVKEIDITVGSAENEDISQIKTSLRRHLRGQELTLIRFDEPHSLPSEESVSGMSREGMRGLGLHISDEPFYMYDEHQEATLSGVVCGPEETVIDLVQSSTRVMSSILYSKQVSESLNSNRKTINIGSLTMRDCKLTATVTSSMWSCLRSFPSLGSLTISDSSLSFPPSPPELTSVTELIAKRVTSQSYEGLLSSLPGLKAIDIIIDDAERDISQIAAGLRRTGRQQLTIITIKTPEQLPLEKNNLSRETMRGLSLLIREQTKNLQSLSVSGVKCIDEDYVDLIEHVQYLKILRTMHFQFLGWGSLDYKRNTNKGPTATLGDCQLSTEMAVMLWACLRSFPTLRSLTISDSSLSFPPSPPELTSVTQLDAERVTSQSYEGLLSSLTGLEVINIRIDDVERDISQITVGLRRTGGQQLTRIDLRATDSLPQEKMTLSRETMRGLGLLIREQTKNLQYLWLERVKCTEEEDLVYLIECCRHAKAVELVVLFKCGTKEGGRLEFHLKRLDSSWSRLTVNVTHDNYPGVRAFRISHI